MDPYPLPGPVNPQTLNGDWKPPRVTAWETVAVDQTCPGLEAVAGACSIPPPAVWSSTQVPSPARAPAPALKEGAEEGAALWIAPAPTQGLRDP